MTLQTFTRKMRGRMRSNTCRIVLLTSLVWVIFDFVLIARYSDCIGKDGWRCRRAGEYDVEVSYFYTETVINCYISLYIPFQLPNAERLVDDNQLVNDNEINTEKSLDGEDNGGGPAPIMGQGFVTGGISMTYRSVALKKWFQAPTVRESRGKPGEMGKPVKIGADMKDIMKEKFKENQFNLLASDMISLNRSLTDVRHEK